MKEEITAGLHGQATPEQIESWKGQYGHVFEIQVGESVCYLKEPNRQTLSAATRFAQTDPLKFNETLLTNCWLGGDESIKTDNGKFLSVGQHLNALIELPQSTIKKL